MRTDIVLRISVWLVHRSVIGAAGEAFAGDLLEMSALGRSPWWCLLQALRAAVSSSELRLRALFLPLCYCVAFVLLHPLWQESYLPSVNRLLMSSRGATVWPGSAVLEILAGLLPAVLFVWSGVFLFLILRPQRLRREASLRILLSLSIGCSVVSAETMLRLGAVQPDLRMLSRSDFYYPASHSHFSALLFAGLFAAIAMLPRGPRPEPVLAGMLDGYPVAVASRASCGACGQ